MKAVDAQLLTLLKKSNQFVVPIYQRAYAWTQGEVEQLWSDILRAGSNESLGTHFTGSVVYVEKGAGAITDIEPNLIIDGQQRVTTVTLILAALAERLETEPEEKREPLDGFAPRKIRNRYLINDDEEGERRYKLVLSQGDRAALFAVIDGASLEDHESGRVAENYKHIRQLFETPGLDLSVACRGLAKLVVVDVHLERGVDNPQLVFEAMNSTGKKLSQADLIRNFVLMDLKPSAQERLYTQYWRPMELDFGAGAYETQFDQFVRHFLTVTTGSIPRVDGIYEAFKEYARDMADAGESVAELVVRLREYSRRFCAIALGQERRPVLRTAFKDLDQIKADVVYPFLLEAYTDHELGIVTESELLEIVEMVTSYVFRRAVCRIPTNSLNTTFATFSRAIRKDQYVDSVKAHFLAMTSYRAFPADAEFADALQTTDLYHFQRRSYFLRLLENHGRKEHVSIEDYTIEHILPQNENLSQAWRDSLGESWQEVQVKYLHTLGNLTLTGYNSEYSDHSFEKKRDMEGGFKDSPLRLNHGLGQLEAWGPVQIEARAAILAARAVSIWRLPTLDPVIAASFAPPKSVTGFTIEDHPTLLIPQRRALFESLTSEILALDPLVNRSFLKRYVSFKAESSFVDVVPQVGRLRLSLNIPFETLHDEQELAYDVSGKGHWGNGPTEVTLDESSDFMYVMGLVRQAYEYQLGVE